MDVELPQFYLNFNLNPLELLPDPETKKTIKRSLWSFCCLSKRSWEALEDIPLAKDPYAPVGMPDVAWHYPADVHGLNIKFNGTCNATRSRIWVPLLGTSYFLLIHPKHLIPQMPHTLYPDTPSPIHPNISGHTLIDPGTAAGG